MAGREGETAQGPINYEAGERASVFFDDGTASCLTVIGNRATVGVSFRGYTGSGRPRGPHGSLFFLEDNGPAAADRIAEQALFSTIGPSSCSAAPPPGVTLGPAYGSGAGVTMTDGPTLPSRRAHCRRGGFAQRGFATRRACIGFVRRTNAVAEFQLPTKDSVPKGIASGSDGALWFTQLSKKIGRITPAGVVSEYPIPDPPLLSSVGGITRGPDGCVVAHAAVRKQDRPGHDEWELHGVLPPARRRRGDHVRIRRRAVVHPTRLPGWRHRTAHPHGGLQRPRD